MLPDDVLFQRYNQPYDALWFETLGVDPERLKDWNQNISRWKLVDLVRMGAVKQGDEFEIPVVTFNGEEEDFHVKVCRYAVACYHSLENRGEKLIGYHPHRLLALGLAPMPISPRSACPGPELTIQGAKTS